MGAIVVLCAVATKGQQDIIPCAAEHQQHELYYRERVSVWGVHRREECVDEE